MQKYNAIVVDDSVNINNLRVSREQIFEQLSSYFAVGGPFLNEHDRTHAIGWSYPTMLSFQPAHTCLHGRILKPETSEEYSDLEVKRKKNYVERLKSIDPKIFEILRDMTKEHLADEIQEYLTGTAFIVSPNLARKVGKDIFKLADDDGLVDLKHLDQIQTGMYRLNEFVIFAHPYFRRGFNRINNFASPLTDALLDLHLDYNAEAKILLDPHAVGLAELATIIPQEFEHDYGPPFCKVIKSYDTEVTRKFIRDDQRVVGEPCCMEFGLKMSKGERKFSAEDLYEPPDTGSGSALVTTRLVHSVIDQDGEKFFHIDGSFLEYTKDQYDRRLKSDIKNYGRDSKETKFWYVYSEDGINSIPLWKQLVSFHFSKNSMVREYFDKDNDGPLDNPKTGVSMTLESGQGINEVAWDPKLQPEKIVAKSSVRLLLSIHDTNNNSSSTMVDWHPYDSDSKAEEEMKIEKADVSKLQESLRLMRGGQNSGNGQVPISKLYYTIPIIRVEGFEKVNKIIDKIKKLLTEWNHAGHDRALTFSIGKLEKSRELRLSVIGHIADIPDYIGSIRKFFDYKDDTELAAWVEEIAEEMFPENCAKGYYPKESDGIVEQLGLSTGVFLNSELNIDLDNSQA